MSSIVRWSLLLAVTGCGRVEYDYHREERVDVFYQNRQRAVDLLLVIDNSCSMQGEQDHLAESFEVLIAALESGDTDWRVAATTSEPALPAYRGRLSGGTDEIVVAASGGEIDRVMYDDRIWPIVRGVALERCDATLPPEDPGGWEMVPAGTWTPGAPNHCPAPPNTGADAGPRAPGGGDLLVTEFLPWSAVDDGRCEWIELTNVTSDTLDLAGVSLRDDGRNAAAWTGVPTLGPGARLVVGRSADPGCGIVPDVVLDAPFPLAQGERWIDRDTENAAEVFSELVAVGTGAFGLEMGMENALITLSDTANHEDAGGFLRDEADLALLFFSDEDDLSPGSVASYADRLRSIEGDAGYREPGRVRFGAAVGTDLPGASGDCDGDDAAYAERYLALMALTGGVSWSICEDLSHVADQAGVTFSEQILALVLSGVPALDTLVVEEYGSDDPESFVGVMVRDVDFVLETHDDAVWVVFPEDRVPPGAVVVVTYEALPGSASVDVEEPS